MGTEVRQSSSMTGQTAGNKLAVDPYFHVLYNQTILSRQLGYTVPFFVVVLAFFAYYLSSGAGGASTNLNERWYCNMPAESKSFSFLYDVTAFVQGAAMLSTVQRVLQIVGVLRSSQGNMSVLQDGQQFHLRNNHLSLLVLVFFMSAINAASQALNHRVDTRVLCADAFGLQTMMFQWLEWISTVPFMIYLLFTLDVNKTRLTGRETLAIFCSGLALVCGFMSTWAVSVEKRGSSGWNMSSVCLVAGSCFMCVVFYEFFEKYREGYSETNASPLETGSFEQVYELRSIMQRTRKQQIQGVVYLVLTLPLFPLCFALAWAGIISQETFLVVICAMSFLAKHVFATNLETLHLEMLDPAAFIIKREQDGTESRRTFLRYVFHEVRVPLNSISMGLSLLSMNTDVNDEDAETIDMMSKAVEFMTDTLNDVLSMQKIEEGKLELTYSPCNILQMVHKVHLTLMGQMEAKKLLWKFIPPPSGVATVVMADRFRLEHVLANLIGNAVKFSPEGGRVTLKIEKENLIADRVGEDGKKVTTLIWSVYDEGVGIKPESQERLFKAYSQIDAHENQAAKGTGVGLVICKEIVELHGGRIGMRSPSPLLPPNVAKGSQFYFSLPLTVIEDVEPQQHQHQLQSRLKAAGALALDSSSIPNASSSSSSSSSSSASSSATTSATTTTVASVPDDLNIIRALIVDDVKSNRMLLSMLLRKRGIVADQADDGKTAIEIVSSHPADHYHVIFMDNLMPIIGGHETITILRGAPHRIACLVIGLTGNADDEDMQEFISAGADLCFSKPLETVTLDKLVDFVHDHGCASLVAERRRKNSEEVSPRLVAANALLSFVPNW